MTESPSHAPSHGPEVLREEIFILFIVWGLVNVQGIQKPQGCADHGRPSSGRRQSVDIEVGSSDRDTLDEK